ncbi:MAG: glycerophosphodiester phosphodiesterase [Planctomycetota bacterium]|nr:glycerophosphodiester phosphodiesterase [Planctomycetota bacterium]
MVIAHRGGSALAPENTFAAFDRAVELGADAVELDVHVSRDGHVVVSHDPTVDRTTDGTGAIADLELGALRALDAGHAFTPDDGGSFPFRGQGVRLPLLHEVLGRYDALRVSIEIKVDGLEATRAVLSCVRAAGAESRVCVGSFQDRPIRWLRAEAPGIATHATAAEVRRFLTWRALGLGWAAQTEASVFTVPERAGTRRVVSPRLVKALARRGVDVHVWCVNEADTMRRLLAWGVRGIVTARPDVALDVVRG